MGGPLLRDAKSFTICETFTSCFLPFSWEQKKSLQLVFLTDTSQWRKQVCSMAGSPPKASLAGMSWIFWWGLLLCFTKVFPINSPEHSKMEQTKQPKKHKPVSGIIYWILDLNIHCFAFFKPQYATGIQDKFITHLKLKGTWNKSINKSKYEFLKELDLVFSPVVLQSLQHHLSWDCSWVRQCWCSAGFSLLITEIKGHQINTSLVQARMSHLLLFGPWCAAALIAQLWIISLVFSLAAHVNWIQLQQN